MTSCDSTENRTNLIVNYLPQSISQKDIQSLFETVGKISSCKLIRDKSTGQSLGYGFVNFHNINDADKAIELFNGKRLQNKIIKVSYARPSCESIKGANLYICGLNKSIGQAELVDIFSSCGTIITSRLLCDQTTGISKGVGFVRFDQRSEAEKAIIKFNGCRLKEGPETLTVKFANYPCPKKLNNTSPHSNSIDFAFLNSADIECPLSPIARAMTNLGLIAPFQNIRNQNIFQDLFSNFALSGIQSRSNDIINALHSMQHFNHVQAARVDYQNPLVNTFSGFQQRKTWKNAGIPGGPVQNSTNHRLRFNPINGAENVNDKTSRPANYLDHRNFHDYLQIKNAHLSDDINSRNTNNFSGIFDASFAARQSFECIPQANTTQDTSSPHSAKNANQDLINVVPSFDPYAYPIAITESIFPHIQMPYKSQLMIISDLINLSKNITCNSSQNITNNRIVDQSSEIDSTSSHQTTILYLKNLPEGTNEFFIRQLFSAFPSFRNVIVMQSQLSNGMESFVVLVNRDEAINAILFLNGLKLNDRIIEVEEFNSNMNAKNSHCKSVPFLSS